MKTLLLIITSLCSNFSLSTSIDEVVSVEINSDGLPGSCMEGDEYCSANNNEIRPEELLEIASDLITEGMYKECENTHEQCEYWAKYGECDKNPYYMRVGCRRACGECTGYDVDMGVDQSIHGESRDESLEVYLKSVSYKREEILGKSEEHSYDVQSSCVNKHELCAFWATIGECEKNPKYMKLQCGPSCQTCHLIDINNRCPLDPNAVDAYEPGEMDLMFDTVTDINGPFRDYVPVVHSHPEGFNTENKTLSENVITDGPWVVTFEKFVTDEEADRLIALGHELEYKRSTDVGEKNPDGTYGAKESETRTSTNAWCVDQCYDDPSAQRVYNRIGNVTGVPEINSENLQLLRYEVGQRYAQHHDFIPHHTKRQCGPRILTFFLYLNDVEEGGATGFPFLKTGWRESLEIFPKKGKALLWPSVLSSDLNKKETRTDHEAKKVIKGVKYAANAWIHLRDFKTPNNEGCV